MLIHSWYMDDTLYQPETVSPTALTSWYIVDTLYQLGPGTAQVVSSRRLCWYIYNTALIHRWYIVDTTTTHIRDNIATIHANTCIMCPHTAMCPNERCVKRQALLLSQWHSAAHPSEMAPRPPRWPEIAPEIQYGFWRNPTQTQISPPNRSPNLATFEPDQIWVAAVTSEFTPTVVWKRATQIW